MATSTAVSRPPEAPRRRWWSLSLAGSLSGLLFAVLSITPSLLPRPTVLQGVLAGLAFAIGYLLGVGLWALIRRFSRYRDDPPAGHRGWWVFYGVLLVLAIAGLSSLTVIWQNDVRSSVMMPPIDGVDLSGFILAFNPTVALFIAIGKATRRMYFRMEDRVGGLLAGVGSAGVVVVIVGALVLTVNVGVEQLFTRINAAPASHVVEPGSEFRSAGEESQIEWDSLGRHGGAFVGGGPTTEQISALTGQPALDPIRVYAGIKSADTIEERADLVVAELERTGAFDRKVLVIAIPTGSGWIEPQTVDAVEYLYGGDTAIASLQYAYTPSWYSFIFDPGAPIEASRVLFETVEDAWRELPVEDRPLLIVYGLSLGAHGSQAVFTNVDDLRDRVDGAYFVGSPNSSILWRTLQAQRDLGSPAWQPVLDDGAQVRWISRAGDETNLSGPWEPPRVLYLQHATDPVTWLTFDLIYRSPEWLDDGQRSPDISDSMRWMPIVTALQVGIDMLGAEAVPASFGHNFGDVTVTGWIQVAGDPGLEPEVISAIQAEIESYAPISAYDGY